MSKQSGAERLEVDSLLHSSSVDSEAVLVRLEKNPNLLKKAYVVLEGGLYKLIIPGETEEENVLTVLTVNGSEIKNARGLVTKVEEAVNTAGYEGEAAKILIGVGTGLIANLYANNKKERSNAPLVGSEPRSTPKGGGIESAQMALVRPFTVVTERGRQSAIDISNEHWERLVLEAMESNDKSRMQYLARQAAEAMVTLTDVGIDADWRRLYDNTMASEMGQGNYPELNTKQGLMMFMEKVYFPVLRMLLSAAEIASTMGDHAAVKMTADLKKEMELALAKAKAETAEGVEPARARTQEARIAADAKIDHALLKNEDVLKQGKRIQAELAAETVASPIVRGAGQIISAGAESAPAFFKGFAEYLQRWLSQEGGDPKLVAVTSGGLAIGIIAGAVVAFMVTPVAGLVVLGAVPTAASAGYMAVKGFGDKK